MAFTLGDPAQAVLGTGGWRVVHAVGVTRRFARRLLPGEIEKAVLKVMSWNGAVVFNS